MSCNDGNCSDINYDICICQNASYRLALQITDTLNLPLDITHWNFSASIKDSIKSPTSVTQFTASIINLASASVSLYVSPTQTSLLTKPVYHYDVIAEVSGSVPQETIRLLEGIVTIDRAVTRGQF